MTLAKDARKIKVNGKDYRWKVGKLRREEDFIYVNVYIETSDGKTHKFEECMGSSDVGVQYPVTPQTIEVIVSTNKL